MCRCEMWKCGDVDLYLHTCAQTIHFILFSHMRSNHICCQMPTPAIKAHMSSYSHTCAQTTHFVAIAHPQRLKCVCVVGGEGGYRGVTQMFTERDKGGCGLQ